MKPVSKQTVLKGALLAVLAANVSWKTASNLMSTDMASELGRSAPAAAPAAPPAVTIAPAPNPTAAKPSAEGAKPDPAATVQITADNEPTRAFVIPDVLVCGEKYVLSFANVPGEKAVRGYAMLGGSTILSATQKNISRTDLETAGSTRDRFVTFLSKAIEAKGCADIVADGRPSPTAPSTPVDEAERSRLEKERQRKDKARAARIARGLRNCTGDETGHALKADEQLDCHIDRIASDELAEENDDMDDIDSDERGGRRRSRERARSSASAQFKASVDFVIAEAASLLSSKDEEDNDDGDEIKSRLKEALRDAKRAGVVSRAEVATAIARVDNLAIGEKFQQRSETFETQFANIDQNISMLTQRLATAQDPMTSNMIGQQIQQLQSQKRFLQEVQLPNDPMYKSYDSLRAQGLVGTEEFSEFTADYKQLLGQITAGNPTQPGALGSVVVPQGAQQFRQQLSTNGLRNNGMSMPAYPQLTTVIPTAQNRPVMINGRPM